MVALTSAIKGKFGFIGITSYLIGMIIGSGIYITSNKIFISVGSWGPAILVWIIVGILSMVGALCFAELAAAYPRQGGSYIYIKKELGCFPGFIYVFTRTVMLNPMSQAVMTIACATQVQIAIKPCTNTVPTKFIACCLILLMFWLHSFHAKLITKFNALITFIKVSTIVGVFIVAIVYLAKNRISLTPAFQEVSSQPSDWVSAFNGCYWSYAGWQSLSVVIEEIKNPRKTFPITVVTGVGIVIVAYVLANMSFFIVLTPQEVKSSTFILNTFAAKIAGFSLEVPFSILVFFSLFGSYLGTGLGSGRYIFSAAREGDLPRPLSLLHWKLNTPIPAQATNMILSLIFIVITESIGVLLGLFVFVSIALDLLVILSLFFLKYRMRNVRREYFQVNVLLPVVYFVFVLAILVASFLKGITELILVPIVFLVVECIVYLVFIKYKLVNPDTSRIEALMCQAFLLVYPS